MQFDGAVRVLVRDFEDLTANAHVYTEFLLDLPAQARFVILARLALAARELPYPSR